MADLKHLYALQFADGTIKVGMSDAVQERGYWCGWVTGKGNPVSIFSTGLLSDARDAEEVVHRGMRANLIPGLGREWFDGLEFDAVVERIEGVLERRQLPVGPQRRRHRAAMSGLGHTL